jgi:ankyrin repeat protein
VLFYAVTQDDSKGSTILKALLQRGADPNSALKKPEVLGWTPLHFACKVRE